MRVIEREMGYMQGKPVMILKPAHKDNRKRFVIKLDDIWKYSDSHNDEFAGFMTSRVLQLCQLFAIDVPTRKQQFVLLMSSISDTIMDGIDDLVKMPPSNRPLVGPDNIVDAQYEILQKAVGMMQ